MKTIAIFVSGSGTNMENLIRKVKDGSLPAKIGLILSDNPQAGAIEKARRHGYEVAVVSKKDFTSKKDFEAAVIQKVEAANIDFIVLAGFMKILSDEFVNRYPHRIINIHPSLLPQFPGAHAIQDAFENKPKLLQAGTGVTVHYVIPEVDAGPVILQRKVPMDPKDTLKSLEAKVHAVEYEIYPQALKKVLEK